MKTALILLSLIITHLVAYKVGKTQGQKDYFNSFSKGDSNLYKGRKWHYVKGSRKGEK